MNTTSNQSACTSATASGEKITAQEIRQSFQTLTERLDAIESTLASMKEGLATAASSPQLAASSLQPGDVSLMDCNIITMTYDDNGQVVYKAKGGQYQKFGVRIWPEVISKLISDPASFKPGPNPVNLHLLVAMGENGPRKVIGLAD
jgi:hypothetical protein